MRRRHPHGAGALARRRATETVRRRDDGGRRAAFRAGAEWPLARQRRGRASRCPLISSPDTPWAEWCQAAQVAEPAAERGRAVRERFEHRDRRRACWGRASRSNGAAWSRMRWRAAIWCRSPMSACRTVIPYWLVWQQREMLNASQAHFAQWIEGQVDAYLRSGGALAVDSCGCSTFSGVWDVSARFVAVGHIFGVPISDCAGNHEASIHVALRPLFAACSHCRGARALRRRIFANPTGERTMTSSPAKKLSVLLASVVLSVAAAAPAFAQSSDGVAAGGRRTAAAKPDGRIDTGGMPPRLNARPRASRRGRRRTPS